ncbi:MAG TPA: hypothetical protein VND87_04450 [Stellaceae bacterium]|nr:hypothetical protein [Stellaceae bacterium]
MAAARILGGAITMLMAAVVATPAALAYTASGDRTFPATLVLPQIAPGDEIYFNYNTIPLTGGATRGSNLTATYMKTITDTLGIEVEETYTRIDQQGAGSLVGWQNLDAELKYRAVNSIAHEFQLDFGLDRETGGTGAVRVGASPSGATTPRVYFGKGFGDLDIGYLRPLAVEGLAGMQFADTAPRPDIATAGFVVEYSIPYLEAKVQNVDLPDWMRRLTPLTEISVGVPAGRSYGARTTALIAPGISYAGDGWELGIEALVPATRATGTGVGVTAQVHFALDYLFPESIGKPLFSRE